VGDPAWYDSAVRFGTEAQVKKIFVTVRGGCAYVIEDTVPRGVAVEIIDFDNIRAGDEFPSDEAQVYCAKNKLYDPSRPAYQ